MASAWMLVIMLAVLVQGRRIPRNGPEDIQQDHVKQLGRVELTRVPLAHALHSAIAVCRMVASSGHKVTGDVVLRQINAGDPVEITGSISGLSPGYHGFHIHQNADLSDNCKGAGPHFNPENNPHGAPQDSVRHAGDLGNIPVDENGVAAFQILDNHISLLDNHPGQVLKRAIVVHQKEDDLGRGGNEESKKTGNAGARVACCIIEPAPYK